MYTCAHCVNKSSFPQPVSDEAGPIMHFTAPGQPSPSLGRFVGDPGPGHWALLWEVLAPICTCESNSKTHLIIQVWNSAKLQILLMLMVERAEQAADRGTFNREPIRFELFEVTLESRGHLVQYFILQIKILRSEIQNWGGQRRMKKEKVTVFLWL